MKKFFIIFLVIFLFAFYQTGTKRKKTPPHEYGKSIISNFSEKAGLKAVVFEHWTHRARFSCRLCHVDIGFAMKNNETNITQKDNMNGEYCGVCHNGKFKYEGKEVFEACSKEMNKENKIRCEKCHSFGLGISREEEFKEFAEKMPKEFFGNGIDWEKAQIEGLIKPIDFIEGLSVKKKTEFKKPQEFSLNAKVEGLPDIIFSHKKHTDWMGCEGCHPDIFIGVKKGTTKYSMSDIFQGKYCGACHNKVAFPFTNCQRCHITPVS